MQKYILKSELSWSSYYTFGTKPPSEVYLANPSQLQIVIILESFQLKFVSL